MLCVNPTLVPALAGPYWQWEHGIIDAVMGGEKEKGKYLLNYFVKKT